MISNTRINDLSPSDSNQRLTDLRQKYNGLCLNQFKRAKSFLEYVLENKKCYIIRKNNAHAYLVKLMEKNGLNFILYSAHNTLNSKTILPLNS